MTEMNEKIDILCDDTLLQIFRYIRPKERLNLSKVCRRWKNVAKHSWRDCGKFFMDYGTDHVTEKGEIIGEYASTELMQMEDLERLLDNCGACMKQITMRHAHEDFKENLIVFKFGSHRYKMVNEDFFEKFLKLLYKCPNVESVRMRCSDLQIQCESMKPSFYEFINWVSSRERLKWLNIRCRQICKNINLIDELPESVVSLDLSYFIAQYSSTQMNKKLPNLQELMVFDVNCEEELANIINCSKNLKKLHIYNYLADGQISETEIQKLTQLSRLENLDLNMNNCLTDDILLSISKCSPEMKKLSIRGNSLKDVTVAGLDALTYYWSDIGELRLIGDEFEKIPLFKNLQFLELHCCHSLSEFAMCHAFEHMRHLTRVTIRFKLKMSCIGNLINFLISVAISRNQNVELVILFFLRQIKTVSIQLGRKPELRVTCMTPNYNFGKDSLKYVLKKFPQHKVSLKTAYWNGSSTVALFK